VFICNKLNILYFVNLSHTTVVYRYIHYFYTNIKGDSGNLYTMLGIVMLTIHVDLLGEWFAKLWHVLYQTQKFYHLWTNFRSHPLSSLTGWIYIPTQLWFYTLAKFCKCSTVTLFWGIPWQSMSFYSRVRGVHNLIRIKYFPFVWSKIWFFFKY